MSAPRAQRAGRAQGHREVRHLAKAYRIDPDDLLASFRGSSRKFWHALLRFQTRFPALDWPRTVDLLELSRTASRPALQPRHVWTIDRILVKRYVELAVGFPCGDVLPRHAEPAGNAPSTSPILAVPAAEGNGRAQALPAAPWWLQVDQMNRLAASLSHSKIHETEPADDRPSISPLLPLPTDDTPGTSPILEVSEAEGNGRAQALAATSWREQTDQMRCLAASLALSKIHEGSCVVVQPFSVSKETKISPWDTGRCRSVLMAARANALALLTVEASQRWLVIVIDFHLEEIHVFGPEDTYEPVLDLKRPTMLVQLLLSISHVLDWAVAYSSTLTPPQPVMKIPFLMDFHVMATFDCGDNFHQAQGLISRIYEGGITRALPKRTVPLVWNRENLMIRMKTP